MSRGPAPSLSDGVRRPPAGPAGDRPSGPAGTRPRSRVDAGAPAEDDRLVVLARGFVALFLEVEAGRRPRGHLSALLTPMLYARLCDVWVRGGAPGHVVSVRVTGRASGGVDLVAIVQRSGRYGAVGLRMVLGRRGWLVDDIALPEIGQLPLPAYPVAPEEDDPPDDLALVPRPGGSCPLGVGTPQ